MPDQIIIPHIREYLEGDKYLVKQVMAQAQDRFQAVMENQFSGERAPRDPGTIKLYPSEAGKCERGVQYKALGIPGEPLLADVRFKFAMGDLVELALVYLIGHAKGLTLSDNNRKHEIQVGRQKWRGASDGIISENTKPRRNLEVKSMSSTSFRITKRKGIDDAFGYLTQAALYTRHLQGMGLIDVPETVFVMVDRDSMHLHEEVVRFDDWSLAEAADAKFDRILDAIKDKKVLPRPYDLSMGKLGLQCKYCPHKYTCWVTPQQAVDFDNEGKPVYKIAPTESLFMTVDRGRPNWVLLS